MRASTSNSSMVRAFNPLLTTHTTTISPKCHHHTHLWANPKSQLYRPSTAKRYTFTSTKPPYLLLLLPQRMTFTYVTLRCLDITTLSNQLSLTPSDNPMLRFQVVAYLLHHNDALSYGQRDCQRPVSYTHLTLPTIYSV